jgi:hypothetical protein
MKSSKKIVSFYLAVFCVSVAFLIHMAMAWATDTQIVLINEFVSNPSSGGEWVELLNNSDSVVSLTDWALEHTILSPEPITTNVSLSGLTIPAHEVLVVTPPEMSDTGAVLSLKNATSDVISIVSYGDMSLGDEPHVVAPSSGESASFIDSSWSISANPTKGLFNNAIELTYDQLVDNDVPTNQNTVFASSLVVGAGDSVDVVSAGLGDGAIWFAPNGTTNFIAGDTMTTASGTATSILAPVIDGVYNLFVINASGNVSAASTATLTVDSVDPTGRVDDPSSYGEVSGSPTVNVVITSEYGSSFISTACLKYGVSGPDNLIACKTLAERDWYSYDYAPSFQFTWDTTLVTDGNYNLYVVMTEVSGNVGTSNPVSVIINNNSEGSSAGNPSLISTCEEFQAISNKPGWYYRLENDIDCSSINNFVGISDFGGGIDGQNYTVSNLTMNYPGDNSYNRSIFGNIAGGVVVRRLKFVNLNMTCGSTYCAGLVFTNSGTVEKVFLSGTLNFPNCTSQCGGFAVYNSGTISQSIADLEMNVRGSYAGLIAGHQTGGNINNCYTTGTINASTGGTIGGLVGLNESQFGGGNVSNSYSRAVITNSSTTGALIGWEYQGSTLNNLYWDATVSGRANMCGDESYGGSGCTNANGLTTAQMKSAENYVGWDFDTIWGINPALNDGYPYLRNNHNITPPNYLNAVAVAKDRIEVNFDKDLDGPALRVQDFEVMDGLNSVSIVSVDEDNGKVTLNLGANLNNETPTVTINPSVPATIKDLWGNAQTATISKTAIDEILPTVTPLGNGLNDYQLPVYTGDSEGVTFGEVLTFSERLSSESKLLIQESLTNGSDIPLNYRWGGGSGLASRRLLVYVTGATSPIFINDVYADLIDLSGNTSEKTLLIDSALDANQRPFIIDSGNNVINLTPAENQGVINNNGDYIVNSGLGVVGGRIDIDPLTNGNNGILPNIIINTQTSAGDVVINIPSGSSVTGPAGWDGIISIPTVRDNSSVVVSADPGMVPVVNSVIEIGFSADKLVFTNAVRVKFAGNAGKLIGFRHGPSGSFQQINTICGADTQAWADANLGIEGDCKMDVGGDLIVWTKHFTYFVTYTQAVGGNSGGGTSGSVSTPNSFLGSRVSILINDGEYRTLLNQVVLTLDGGNNAKKMAISNGNTYVGVVQEPYTKTRQWVLPGKEGEKFVCVRFYDQNGYFSDMACDSIVYGADSTVSQSNNSGISRRELLRRVLLIMIQKRYFLSH